MKTTIFIGGEEVEVEEKLVDIKSLLLDDRNPRMIESLTNSLSQSAMFDIFDHDPDTISLIENIRNHGGLLKPPIVTQKRTKYCVRDGNRRTYSMQTLHKEDPKNKKWQKTRVHILPKGFSEEKIQTYLGIIHGEFGEKDWPPYCKAAYAVSWCRKYGKTIEDVERDLGITPSEFALKETTYDVANLYMEETGDTNPHWSQWYEAIRPAINKVPEVIFNDEKKRKLIFTAMENGKMGNPHLSRHLKSVIDSTVSLKRLCKQGMETALLQSKNGKKPAESFFNCNGRLSKSMLANRKELIKRLKEKNDSDISQISETLSEIIEILNESGNSDVVETAML